MAKVTAEYPQPTPVKVTIELDADEAGQLRELLNYTSGSRFSALWSELDRIKALPRYRMRRDTQAISVEMDRL